MVQLIDINNLYIDEDGDWALSYELEKPVIHKRKKKYWENKNNSNVKKTKKVMKIRGNKKFFSK